MNRQITFSANLHSAAHTLVGAGRWQPLADRVAWRTAVGAISLLALFVVFMAAVQFATPDLVGNDGYYHIKMAYLMRTRGLAPSFEWLPLTVLNAEEFVDHHFLYHVLLIPFTFGDLRLGAKLASVIFPALAFLAVWWLLRGQRVPYAGLWALGLLAVSEAFIYRMSMPRAQSLSLGVLALALHWLLTGKHRRLVPLGFLYVWLYNAFPLIVMLAGVYVAARWLTDRRLEWQALAYAGLGVGLGLIINPYFPDNLLFILRHVGPKVADPTATRVGNEWYPYKTTQLIENSSLALAAFVSGVLALGLHNRRMSVSAATGLLSATLFGAMLFQSRRFVEYWPAFALIFGALAWTPIIRDRLSHKASRFRPRRHGLLVGLMVVGLAVGVFSNLDPARSSLQRSKPYERYAGAATWLQANTPQGSRVFQTDWDDFTRLFFFNTHNTYTVGLDPTYMELYDGALFELWVDISKGRVERPGEVITEQFGAEWIMTDLKHKDFLREADDDPSLEQVYRDQDAAIFRVVQNH